MPPGGSLERGLSNWATLCAWIAPWRHPEGAHPRLSKAGSCVYFLGRPEGMLCTAPERRKAGGARR
eukprot:1560375-Alexandrium_andersonii.AAC.1